MGLEKIGIGAYGDWDKASLIMQNDDARGKEEEKITLGSSQHKSTHFYMTRGHKNHGRYNKKSMEDAISYSNDPALAQGLTPAIIDQTLWEMHALHGLEKGVGSTAILATINLSSTSQTSQVMVANIGDSYAFHLFQNEEGKWEVKQLNTIHEPSSEAESERLRKDGGTIIDKRLNGDLALTRALGDIKHEGRGISHQADIHQLELPKDGFILLASDSIKEKSEEPSNYLKEFLNKSENKNLSQSEILKKLADDTILQSTDNTSYLLMDLATAQVGFLADGHGGDSVSQTVAANIIPTLQKNLRPENQSTSIKDFCTSPEYKHLCEILQNFPRDQNIAEITKKLMAITDISERKKQTLATSKELLAKIGTVKLAKYSKPTFDTLKQEQDNLEKLAKKKIEEKNKKEIKVPLPLAPPYPSFPPPEPSAPPLEAKEKTIVEAKIGIPEEAKAPDPKTGKTFDLLSAESKAVYKNLGFDIEEKENEKKERFLVLKKGNSTHEVHRWHMTTKVSEGKLSDAAKLNLMNVANTVMAAIDKASKAWYVWVDSDNPEAKAFLTNYYQENNFIITNKPENIDLPSLESKKTEEAEEPKKENANNSAQIKPYSRRT